MVYLSGSPCKPFSGLSDDSASKKVKKTTTERRPNLILLYLIPKMPIPGFVISFRYNFPAELFKAFSENLTIFLLEIQKLIVLQHILFSMLQEFRPSRVKLFREIHFPRHLPLLWTKYHENFRALMPRSAKNSSSSVDCLERTK